MPDQRFTTLTIPSGQTVSSAINLRDLAANHIWYGNIFSPAVLPETITLQTADTSTGVFGAQQSGGVDITCPAAKRTAVQGLVAAQMRLSASGAVAADRTFIVELMALR